MRRLTETLMEIRKHRAMNCSDDAKILMAPADLVIFAAEIEKDLGAPGGSIYPVPHRQGFEFDSIRFELLGKL